MLVRAANPIWWLPDLTGLPLNDEYYAFFLTNTLPYLPQPVFQDENGLAAWPDPLEFQPSGTLPNNLYFDPTLVYRIEIRHGNTQNDPLIWLIENFIPGSGNVVVSNTFQQSQNIVMSPQFATIDFSSPLTFTQASPGTYTIDVAPGWTLVLTGTGTTVLTQFPLAGSNNQVGNPPYYLQINNSGWTTADLIFTVAKNGAIFANGSVAMSFLARAYTAPETVSANYIPSTGSTTTLIPPTSVPIAAFTLIRGFNNIPASTNSDTGGAAFVKFDISLQGTGKIDITDVQILGQSVPVSTSFTVNDIPPFIQETPAQQVNDQINFYFNSILTQPKTSLLAGWNFGQNPWQFTTTASTNVAANQYTADQTIVIQQNYVASATGNNVAAAQDSFTNNFGYKTTAVTAHNQFAILQYIDPETIRPYWGNKLSSMVKAFITTTHSSSVRIKMRLIYKAGLPGTISQTDPIASWTESTPSVISDPVAAAGYTLIAPNNDPVYTLTTVPSFFAFDGFVLPASTNANMTLGILLYTVDNMNQAATADFITINDVSLVYNDFAIQTNADTFDTTLRKCQFYYEKSYNLTDLPGTTSSSGAYSNQPASTTTEISGLIASLKVTKRKVPPLITWYSTSTGTAARIFDVTSASDLTVSITINVGQGNTGYPRLTGNATDGDTLWAHWTAAARIGVASET